MCGSLLSASSPTVSPQQSTTAVGCLFLAGLEARSQRVHIFYSQCSGPSLSSKGCLMTLDTLLFLCLPMDPGHPWEGYSLPPAALGSNTGIIHFYENPPGLPLNGPTTTGTRCAGLRLGMGREEGGGKGGMGWLRKEGGSGDGRWETLGMLSSPARRRRSWVGREGLSRLLRESSSGSCGCVRARVCVCVCM